MSLVEVLLAGAVLLVGLTAIVSLLCGSRGEAQHALELMALSMKEREPEAAETAGAAEWPATRTTWVARSGDRELRVTEITVDRQGSFAPMVQGGGR